VPRKRRARRLDPRLNPALLQKPEWRWRTLPVWVALTGGFVLGWYVAAIASPIQPEQWSYLISLAVLAGFWFGVSRMLVRRFIDPIIARRRAKAAAEQARAARAAGRGSQAGRGPTPQPPP
jgi:hypothetical protein